MLFGRELTESIDLVAGLPPDHDSAKTPPEYVAQLRDRLELAHRIAREALGESVLQRSSMTRMPTRPVTILVMQYGIWLKEPSMCKTKSESSA